MRHLFAGLCLALSTLPGLVAAETSPLCGQTGAQDWNSMRAEFVGDWQIRHQSGYARTGNMTLPFGDEGKSETMNMSIRDGDLIATHPEAQAPLVIRPAEEGRWNVDASEPYKPAPVLSPDEVALIYGCDQMELPRLIGTTVGEVDGIKMTFTYRFMAIDLATLYGVMEVTATVHGMPSVLRRTVWMHAAGT